jgi:hypothetical protein
MSTRIVIPVQAPDGNGSACFDIDEPFDTVMFKLTPEEQPKTPEEYRANLTFNKVGGGRVFISVPPTHFWVEEID